MKKGDFLKQIKENNAALNPQNVNNTVKNIEIVNQSVEKLKNNVKQLKDMGVVGEDFDGSKNYESQTEFFMDLIDDLFFKKFNLSYFKQKNNSNGEGENKPISQMSDMEFKSFMETKMMQGGNTALFRVINLIKKGMEELSGDENADSRKTHPLRAAYLALQDIIRQNLEENFANQKVFSIIAEAEAPKITKQEILEYLKRETNE